MRKPFRKRRRLVRWVLLVAVIVAFFMWLQTTPTWEALPSQIKTPIEKITKGVNAPIVKPPASTDQTSNNKAQKASNQTKLQDLTYHSGDSPVIQVNNGKANLNMGDWTYNHVVYNNIDALNRTSKGNTGYLEPRNVTNDSLREAQNVEPTGWHQKYVDGQPIQNRGHLIAYSISKGIAQSGEFDPGQQAGDLDNIKNLFTQTAFSNQRIETIYESKVRESLRQGHKVIYQATPIFKGVDQMARGIHLQALSDDGSLNFNVYIFNVQPNVEFNYLTGRSTIKREMKVPVPQDAPQFNN